jgi:hypothetical protein
MASRALSGLRGLLPHPNRGVPGKKASNVVGATAAVPFRRDLNLSSRLVRHLPSRALKRTPTVTVATIGHIPRPAILAD